MSCTKEEGVGGGAINEKKRKQSNGIDATTKQASGYDPESYRSHIWHALEGLDRYPNYLSRWSADDMDRLEGALEAQLSKVREQRQSIQSWRTKVKDFVQSAIQGNEKWSLLLKPPESWDDIKRILDPRAVEAIFRSASFKKSVPLVENVLSGEVDIELDAHLLEPLMDEELYDVYSLPLFSTEFCEELREFVRMLCHDKDLLGKKPVDLDTVGLGWLADLLMHLVMRPISNHLYKETESIDRLDWRQAYVAGYSATPRNGTPRQRLVSHTDDSEVTLNLCLSSGFEGGNLLFRGLRGNSDLTVIGEYQPKQGTALLHSGRHFHEVTNVTNGDRYVLIVWARSWSGSRRKTCPCCWLNRRQDKSCVCDWRWN